MEVAGVELFNQTGRGTNVKRIMDATKDIDLSKRITDTGKTLSI